MPPLSGREEAFRLLMRGYVLLFGVGSIAFLVYQNLLLDLLNRLAQALGLPTLPLSTEQFWLALTVSLMVTLTVLAFLVQRNVLGAAHGPIAITIARTIGQLCRDPLPAPGDAETLMPLTPSLWSRRLGSGFWLLYVFDDSSVTILNLIRAAED